jgi:hypothetical protein
MAEGVVGVLEVVEVHEEGGHRVAVAARPHQHLVGPVEDELAVGQAGQRIVQCPVGQQLLELLPLGDVPDVGHVAADRGSVELVGDDRLDVADRTVAAQHAELEYRGGGLGVELVPEAHPHVVLVVGVHEVGGSVADELVGPVAEELLDGRREVAEDPFGVDDDRDVGRVLDQRPESVLAEAHGTVGLLLLLHGGAGHADHEEEDECTHDGDGRGLGQWEPRGDPVLPDAHLAEGHAGQAPHHHRRPRPRPTFGDHLEGDEGVGAPQHGAPAGQVDDDGDGGHLRGDPEVQRVRGLTVVVDTVDHQVARRNGDEHDEPHPGRHPHHVAEVHEHEQGQEGERAHQVGDDVRVHPEPGTAARTQVRLHLVVVHVRDGRQNSHGPLVASARLLPALPLRRAARPT